MRTRLTAILIACAVVLTACAEKKFTREDAIKDRIEGGASEEIATCFVDKVIAALGVHVLDPDFKAGEEQRDKLTGLFGECMAIPEDTTG